MLPPMFFLTSGNIALSPANCKRLGLRICNGNKTELIHSRRLTDSVLSRGDMADYHLPHSARAELCRRLGRTAEARASYERALALTAGAGEEVVGGEVEAFGLKVLIAKLYTAL